jgi:hypothetical protein
MTAGTLSKLDRDFAAFHAKNPQVYNRLVALAKVAKRNGRTQLGIKMLYEVLRWEIFITTTGDDYRLNNNWPSRYARLIMEQEPGLAGIFELRELRS